jgi:putative SOS response-associated peptidase YedK
MCSRYALHLVQHPAAPALFDSLPDSQPRYNIAPSQWVPVIRAHAKLEREWVMMRFGLIPRWAKPGRFTTPLSNARAETLMKKPSFRESFLQRRCLIPASGYYEWKIVGGRKLPHHIRLKDSVLFAFAGLYDGWMDPAGEAEETCTIITTAPNELVGAIHPRMPVILDPKDYEVWLDPRVKDAATLTALLRAYPAEKMRAYPVSPLVNNAKIESPECAAPLSCWHEEGACQ